MPASLYEYNLFDCMQKVKAFIIGIMNYTTIFFDLDETLYKSETGLWGAIRERISLFMDERLGLPKGEINELRKKYLRTYGTTLRGLQRHHNVNADEFLDYVHDLPLDQYLQPEPEMHDLLISLPQQKWIFTNADANHATRVINHLGLSGCFDGIVDIRALQFVCKPEAIAYQRALQYAGNPAPEACVMLDDSIENLKAAQQLGFTTIWITPNGNSNPAARYSIHEITQLRNIMPELWSTS